MCLCFKVIVPLDVNMNCETCGSAVGAAVLDKVADPVAPRNRPVPPVIVSSTLEVPWPVLVLIPAWVSVPCGYTLVVVTVKLEGPVCVP